MSIRSSFTCRPFAWRHQYRQMLRRTAMRPCCQGRVACRNRVPIRLCPAGPARHKMPSALQSRHPSAPLSAYIRRNRETSMPAPLLSIETPATLPSAADVVVIGGGIVGACTAYYLARRGVKVALVEKGRIGAEQSSRNWGWCRQQNRDARELPMATASLALWEAMEGEIGEERRLPPQRAALSLERRGRDRRLGPLAGLRPHPGRRHAHALAGGGDRARPRDRQALEGWRLLPHRRHRRSRARRPGDRPRGDARSAACVHQSCAARGLELEAGRVAGVVTEAGRHPHPHRGACRRGLGLLLLPAGRDPLPPGRGALLDPRSRPRRRRARRAAHLPGLADPARGWRLHPRRHRHRAGRSDAAADPLRPRSSCRCSPDAGACSPRRSPGLARGPRNPRPLAARPAHADGAHPHPRPPPRCRDDPRNPRPGARSSFPASRRSRSPPNGRATSTRPRTGCRRSAAPRSPA